jgi:5-methylcytosine-specific restriction protein A
MTDAERRREKEAAKALRASRWWQNLLQGTTCYYCSKAIKKLDVTMDHIVPIAAGGKSTRGNVVPACKDCNTKKKDRTAVDWQLEGD